MNVRQSLLNFVFATLITAFAAAPGQAQTIRGVVIDDSSKVPLASAVITLLNNRGAEIGKPPVRSDSLGRFMIHAGEMGRYQVRVTRIGYQPLTSSNISFSFGGQVANVTLNMTAATTKLGKVVVTGTTRLTNSELMSYVGFDLRKSKGDGKFLDTAELARYGKDPAGAMLVENKVLFGLEFVPDANGFEVMRMLRGANFCLPEVWIDGFEANPNTAVMRLLGMGADQLYGVEVYNGMQLPPPSIGGEIGITAQTSTGRGRSATNNMRQNQLCGAVAIWTKGFAEEMKKKAAVKPPPR